VNVDVQVEQGAVVVLGMAPLVPRPIDPLRLRMTVAEARALVTVLAAIGIRATRRLVR
jgi:hypothetical protein